jgi:thiol-disulfide isomerase/thioredoxin
MIKKLTLHALLCLILLITGETLAPAKNKTTLYFFWGNGCPHCDREKIFLGHLAKKYPELKIKSYEVWYDLEHAGLLASMAKAYGMKGEGVPLVFIGDFDPLVGYLGDETTGRVLEEQVAYCIKNGCNDPSDRIAKPFEQEEQLKKETSAPSKTEKAAKQAMPEKVVKEKKKPEPMAPLKEGAREREEAPVAPERKEFTGDIQGKVVLPLVGEIDTSHTSVPLLTVVIAGLDGFNPCAFFVLFLLLSILVHAHSRKTMLLIGGTFVFFSGLIYFLFMAAWLNVFLLFGQIRMITIAAGVIAALIAVVNIKDFFFLKKGVSLTIPDKAKPRLFERIRGLLKKNSLTSMMFGTVILAIAANTYELLCTAGFPMVYTRALTLHKLSQVQYYLYLVFYNAIYVIPLACIVLMFAVTLGARKFTEWQGQILKLISGVMMLYLGGVLLIRPALLNNIYLTAGLLAMSLCTAGAVIFLTQRLKGEEKG